MKLSFELWDFAVIVSFLFGFAWFVFLWMW